MVPSRGARGMKSNTNGAIAVEADASLRLLGVDLAR